MEGNIFEALRREKPEVVMCRFLADLLDPRGRHGCGTRFLESFLREIVVEIKDLERAQLEKTCVMTEYLIDNGRRIDIAIQNPRFFVPIEVKINARDQEGQCYDYALCAWNAPLVYLTIDGHKPSEKSMTPQKGTKAELPAEQILCVKWEQIRGFLEAEGKETDQVKQYTEAIRLFLPGAERQADNARICEVLKAFQDGIDQSLAKRYGLVEPDFEYGSYSKWRKDEDLSFCPGLNYKVANVRFSGRENLRMWFRIEVSDDGCLIAGFCLVNIETRQKIAADTVALEDLCKYIRRPIILRDNWWVVWRFSNGKQDVSWNDAPNFKTMNDCAARLIRDEGARKKFVEEAIRVFEDQLLRYLR